MHKAERLLGDEVDHGLVVPERNARHVQPFGLVLFLFHSLFFVTGVTWHLEPSADLDTIYSGVHRTSYRNGYRTDHRASYPNGYGTDHRTRYRTCYRTGYRALDRVLVVTVPLVALSTLPKPYHFNPLATLLVTLKLPSYLRYCSHYCVP